MQEQSYLLEEKGPDRLDIVSKIYNPTTEEFLRDTLNIQQGQRVLEIACGFGNVSQLLTSYVGEKGSFVGLDLNEEALHIAKARTSENGVSNCLFINFDINEIDQLEKSLALQPFQKFDLVYGRFILGHLKKETIPIFLKKLKGLLNPGGKIAFEESMDLQEWVANSLKGHFPSFEKQMDLLSMCDSVFGLDFRVGKKLPHMLELLGYQNAKQRITNIQDSNEEEIKSLWRLTFLVAIHKKIVEMGILTEDELSALIKKSEEFEQNETIHMKIVQISQVYAYV